MGQTVVSPAGEGSVFQASETLIVETSRFGAVEVRSEAVITMAGPILGFPAARHFFLKCHSDNSPLMWFQSMEEPNLAFVVIDPRYILADYQPPLKPGLLKSLEAADSSSIDLLVILSIPSGGEGTITANLMAPLVINTETRLVAQPLFESSGYDCRWPVPPAA